VFAEVRVQSVCKGESAECLQRWEWRGEREEVRVKRWECRGESVECVQRWEWRGESEEVRVQSVFHAWHTDQPREEAELTRTLYAVDKSVYPEQVCALQMCAQYI